MGDIHLLYQASLAIDLEDHSLLHLGESVEVVENEGREHLIQDVEVVAEEHAVVALTTHDPHRELGRLVEFAYFEIAVGFEQREEADLRLMRDSTEGERTPIARDLFLPVEHVAV